MNHHKIPLNPSTARLGTVKHQRRNKARVSQDPSIASLGYPRECSRGSCASGSHWLCKDQQKDKQGIKPSRWWICSVNMCYIYIIYKHSQQHDKHDIWVCIQKWGVDLGQFIAVSCAVGHVYNRRITIYFYPIVTSKCTYTNLIKNPNYVGYHHITSRYFYPLK